ncbi:copper amine oxidase N-terminal domain-containing protein [Heliorestis acidaminivorans]|uniref:Copper amine oxidase N-terminal domain-containing protein n=1 Tax=Heliorestis acidaminivorans TaxID=553427 RepID=A0A6I0ERK3_9FIRM|nr:copper amine oxidase N-terminal domain-containing protein [Heliorestis acidaminivorans]KAB2951306.1 copper amine oxidase N-terminal domain-containing protein [Heliorestis acidaminivorans]
MKKKSPYKLPQLCGTALITAGLLLLPMAQTSASATSLEVLKLDWEDTYGERQEDRGYNVLRTRDGGYILVGETYTDYRYGGDGDKDVYVVRTDAKGLEKWKRAHGGTAIDWGTYIDETDDGAYIIVGTTYSKPSNDSRPDTKVYLLKINEKGQKVWDRAIGGTGDDQGAQVLQTEDGGFIIIGETKSMGSTQGDVYLVKTNQDGQRQWEKNFGGKENDRGVAIRQSSDGTYILLGETFSFGAGGYDIYLIKTDQDGKSLWTRTFGDKGWERAYNIEETDDGGYIIVGKTSSQSNGSYDSYIIKTDPQGHKEWEVVYGQNGKDMAKHVRQTPDGGYLIAGWAEAARGNWDFYLLKLDNKGETKWSKKLSNAKFDESFAIQYDGQNGYLIAGTWAEHIGWNQHNYDNAQVYLARIQHISLQDNNELETFIAPEDEIKIILNDSRISLEQEPVIRQERLLIPLTTLLEIAEEVANNVTYKPENRTLTIEKEDKTIQWKLQERKVKVGEETIELALPFRAINGTTYVPLQFLSQALAMNLAWEGETKTVYITTEEK